MRRALAHLDSPDGIALVESQLLGTLLICPYLRLDCGTLRLTDFASPYRGAAFAAIMVTKHPEVGLVVAELERQGIRPPPNCTGWADALCRTMDVTFVEDDAVPEAVRAIKEAARARRLSVLGRRDD